MQTYDCAADIDATEQAIIVSRCTPFISEDNGKWKRCSAAVWAYFSYAIRAKLPEGDGVGLMLQFRSES